MDETASALDRPPPPRRRSWLRVVFYLLLGLFALSAAGIGFLVWKFTPLAQIDEKHDQMSFLGGWVRINGKEGTLQVGKTQLDTTQNAHHFAGRKPFSRFSGGHGPFAADQAQLRIRFSSGTLDLVNAPDHVLDWKCDTPPLGDPPAVEQIREQMVLDMSRGRFGRCSLAIPSGLTVAIDARGGRIEADQPVFDLRIDGQNSKVLFKRNPARSYRFDTQLESVRMLGLPQVPADQVQGGAVWAGISIRFGSLVLE